MTLTAEYTRAPATRPGVPMTDVTTDADQQPHSPAGGLLATAETPVGLRTVSAEQLPALATEIRALMLDMVSTTAEAELEAAHLLEEHGIGVTVADPRWVAPVNPALLRLATYHTIAVCVEDGIGDCGIGAVINQSCMKAGVTTPVHSLGLPNAFHQQGQRDDILAAAGITGPDLAATAGYLWFEHPRGCPPAVPRDRPHVYTPAGPYVRSTW
jgi:deoxyxylulose-5-phosphate synthase